MDLISVQVSGFGVLVDGATVTVSVSVSVSVVTSVTVTSVSSEVSSFGVLISGQGYGHQASESNLKKQTNKVNFSLKCTCINPKHLD